MEYPPPVFFFSGITFNKNFYTSSLDEDIISKTYADSLYLKKTTSDTSLGPQTFLSSICCQYIQPSLLLNPPVPDNIKLYDELTATLNILNNTKTATLNINRPITINYGVSNFSNNTQCGFYGTATSAPTVCTSGTTHILLTMPVLPRGTYIFSYFFNVDISATTSITVTQLGLGFSKTTTISNALQGLYNYFATDMTFSFGTNQKYTSVGIYEVNAINISPTLLIRYIWTGTATVTATGTYNYVRVG
jgi:hypothetical protein